MKPVHLLTPPEALTELNQLLEHKPQLPWEALESRAFRERKAELELWLLFHPPVATEPRAESPVNPPRPRRAKPLRRPSRLQRRRRFGVIA